MATAPDGRLLEEVQAAQERRLARARAPDEHDRLVLAHGDADPVEDVVVSEVLLDIGGLEDDVAKGNAHRSPRDMRFSMRSWKYEKMIVSTQ